MNQPWMHIRPLPREPPALSPAPPPPLWAVTVAEHAALWAALRRLPVLLADTCMFRCYSLSLCRLTSLVAQTVKRLPVRQKTWVQSLGQEDPLEKAMAPHSSTLAWKILWTEEAGRLQSMGLQRVRHDWATSLFSLSCIGEGNGNPLQYSCLENPMDRGAW